MSAGPASGVAARGVRFSNLKKVLYPAVGFTKGQVVDYYRRIAPIILPHLKDRPLTLKRYPDGVAAKPFWTKECPTRRPGAVRTVAVWSPTNRRDQNFCLANNPTSLLWAANLAALELHVSLSRAADLQRPTAMVFDLDPGPPATIVECARVGLWLRELFERHRLRSFPKTSGSKGLHVLVPLNTSVTYEQTKSVAHALAEQLEQQHPQLVLANMRRNLREGKVLIDWSQNDDHKTTVCAYSLRAKTRPTVSTPVTWDEVEAMLRAGDPERLVFDTDEVIERVERFGDLFAPLLKLRQKLPTSIGVDR